MIDLHSHVLPGIDDGPRDLEGVLDMARSAVAAGTTVMAATPHIDLKHGVDPAGLPDLRERVQAALQAAGIELRVVQGGEVAMSRLPQLDAQALRRVTLGSGSWLLVECPFTPTQPVLDFLGPLAASGFRVILAHPERCPAFIQDPETLAACVDAGVLTQVTASSFSGVFGQSVREAALTMLAAGLVHVVASDAHDARHRGPDIAGGLDAAAEALEGVDELREWLTAGVPGAIVDGRPVPARPQATLTRRRRRLFSRRR